MALAALNILDTPAEERYDRIVRLTSRMVQVPIAYVSCVSDGAYEIFPTDDPDCEDMLGFERLVGLLAATAGGPLDDLLTQLHEHRGSDELDDDLSILRVSVR